MAWQYVDWTTLPTPAARAARARLHLAEVFAKIEKPSVTADGKGMTEDRFSLVNYAKLIQEQVDREEQRARKLNGGLSYARFGSSQSDR